MWPRLIAKKLFQICLHLLAVSTLIGQSVSGQRTEFHPILRQSRPGNPGLRLRLMPTGLAYMRELGMKLINQEIPKLVLPRITETVENNRVTLYNARIERYWRPRDYNLDLLPPNRFSWSMVQMAVRSTGNFDAKIRLPLIGTPFDLKGRFNALLAQMSMAISIGMQTLSTGAPSIRAEGCKVEINNIDMVVRDTGIFTDFVLNALKGVLIARLRPMIERRMCQRIQQMIDRDANHLLATMPLTVRLDQQSFSVIGSNLLRSRRQAIHRSRSHSAAAARKTLRVRNGAAASSRPQKSSSRIPHIDISDLNFISQIRKQPFVIDYRLIADPFIDQTTINMFANGEVSWRGLGGTPFHPPAMNVPSAQGGHMAEFFASDYIANSLLYHAYKRGLMDITVGPESSDQFNRLLRTTCETGFCFGEVLGEIGKIHPDKQMEVAFRASRAPTFLFETGKATIDLIGRVEIFIRDTPRKRKISVISSKALMKANVFMWITGNTIRGNSTVDVLDFDLVDTIIPGVDQEVMSDLGLFGAEFVGGLLTEIFGKGILIPTVRGLALRAPRLSFHQRYLLIQSYFTLNERYATRIVAGAVQRGLTATG